MGQQADSFDGPGAAIILDVIGCLHTNHRIVVIEYNLSNAEKKLFIAGQQRLILRRGFHFLG
jgi:hypothetical protein